MDTDPNRVLAVSGHCRQPRGLPAFSNAAAAAAAEQGAESDLARKFREDGYIIVEDVVRFFNSPARIPHLPPF
jgi:hypothetical protein